MVDRSCFIRSRSKSCPDIISCVLFAGLWGVLAGRGVLAGDHLMYGVTVDRYVLWQPDLAAYQTMQHDKIYHRPTGANTTKIIRCILLIAGVLPITVNCIILVSEKA